MNANKYKYVCENMSDLYKYERMLKLEMGRITWF